MTTEEQLQARIAELENENASLKAKSDRPLSLKVSQKGAVSAYGLGRFPVTLYASQWAKLLSSAPTVASFVVENSDALNHKDEEGHASAIEKLTAISSS